MLYNLVYNPVEHGRREALPVCIDVKCADAEQGYCDVLNALRDELISAGDIEEGDDPWQAYACRTDTPPGDGYDIRVIFDEELRETAHDVNWSDVFTFEKYIGAKYKLVDDCGSNADWFSAAYHLGNGAPNHEPGGVYLLDNEDGNWSVIRRYYVTGDGNDYEGASDALRAALPESFDGYNDAFVPLVEPMDPGEAAQWLEDNLKSIREPRTCHCCGAVIGIPTGMPVPF